MILGPKKLGSHLSLLGVNWMWAALFKAMRGFGHGLKQLWYTVNGTCSNQFNMDNEMDQFSICRVMSVLV